MPYQPAYALDPRHDPHPPFARCASIPLEQLGARIFELPHKSHHLKVARCTEAEMVAKWLHDQGWNTEIVDVDHTEFQGRHALWNPNQFLKDCFQYLSGMRKVVDLGCGVGRDVVYVAMHDVKVVGVDHLPDAIKRGQWLADHYLNDREKQLITWKVCDALDALDEVEDADLVIMASFYDPGILDRVGDHIREGGYILLDAFSEVHYDQFGKPKPPKCVPLHDPLLPNFDEIMGDHGWRTEEKHSRRALLQRRKTTALLS